MYDIIVIGTGSMGISACYFLAQRGVKVLGFDQFTVPHEKGGHNGESRLVRKAYFEHPSYIPLLNRAYELWDELEEITGKKIFYKTGLIYFGKPDHPVMKGIRYAASQFDIPVEYLQDCSEFEQFNLPAGFTGVFEPDAGFVIPELTISLYSDLALAAGAELHFDEKVIAWEKQGNGFRVRTNKSEYSADKILFTAGPWVNKILPSLAKQIKVTRQVLAWANPLDPANFTIGNFPCWMIADEDPGVYYGFPALKDEMKFAWHKAGSETDPDQTDRVVNQKETEHLQSILKKYFPAAGDISRSSVCLYDNSPDENFLLGKLPGEENAFIASGFSGHGFKFVPVIGEIVSDLIISGNTNHDIAFLDPLRLMS